ncbi:MAG: DUF3854 domain-containing protein [Scytonema sp. CRU_2_7]|nr:DUF3854 domain-containing protein [Scytonema sp. CRU_2_7]
MHILSHHLEEWTVLSSVTDSIVEQNVYSLSESVEIDKLLNRNTDRRWKHTFNCPGWYVKGVNPIDGSECWESCQFKPDVPRTTKDGKAIKYESVLESRIAPLFLQMLDRDYWHKVRENLDPIVITEGAKKAGCGLSNGYATVSIPGVWNGQCKGRLHHFLKHFCQPGRRFYLAFDSDVMEKDGVQKALIRLSRLLLEHNCNVSIVMFPGGEEGKVGLDDFVHLGGSLQGAIDNAKTFEEWNNELIDSTPKQTRKQVQIARMEKAFGNRVKLMVRGNNILVDGKPYNANFGYLSVEKKYGIGGGKDFFNECLQWLASENEQDPVKDYLEECADRFGDTTIEMIEGMATRYLGTDHPIYDVYLKKHY